MADRTSLLMLPPQRPIAVADLLPGKISRSSGRAANEGFVIKHFAGHVEYMVRRGPHDIAADRSLWREIRGWAWRQGAQCKVAPRFSYGPPPVRTRFVTGSASFDELFWQADGFLQKNNNSLHVDLELVLTLSEQSFMQQLVALEAAATPPQPSAVSSPST